MKTYDKGFTLIELIVVITIIAILAATALPRFINAQKDARVAKTNAVLGSMRSAAALAKSRCELDLAKASSTGTTPCNSNNGGTSFVDMDGVNVNMVLGYPTADNNGIVVAAQINPIADGLTLVGGNSTSGSTLSLEVLGGANGTCTISYEAAKQSGSAVVAPVMSATTSGC